MDDTPPLKPIERFGVLETDTLCVGCHYNLHGQRIEVDDRLNMAIVRCPECGRFHPAGTGVTAASTWLRRLTTLLMFIWIIAVLFMLTALGGIAGAFDAASVGPYLHGEWVNNAPLPPTQQGLGMNNWNNGHFVYTMEPWINSHPDGDRYPPTWVMLFVSGMSIVIGWFVGTLCVTLMWHWRRPMYLIVCLLPAVPAFLIGSVLLTDHEYSELRNAIVRRIACQGGFQVLGILIGIAIGRHVSRTIIRAVIPAGPRKSLAFLWQVDGKTVPL